MEAQEMCDEVLALKQFLQGMLLADLDEGALLRRSGTFKPDFQARMKQFLLKNQQKKERIRQSLRVEEEPDVDPMPRINERSKSIPRNVSHLIAWNYEKENKLSRLRDVEAAKQEAICVGKPSIIRWKNANEAKHTQQKQLQDTLTMIECTFRNPFYQEAWNTLDHKPTDKGSKEKQTNDAFFERCMMWAEKRDQQVALERKTFQQRQLKEYCSTTTSPERQDLTTEELVTRLYSTLDLQELAGELSPEYNSIGSDDEGVHGFPKYTFTDLGEFAGR
eukprot:jgi/Phyca11/16439/fgenesh1_pg.PHYCAscaffold_20_\